MAKSNGFNLNLPSLDDLFTTEAEREDAKLEKVVLLTPEEISDFPNHPFQVRMDDAMKEMVQSVRENGVLVPALVRPKEGGGYEMVSGHRRKRAAELAGLQEISHRVSLGTDVFGNITRMDNALNGLEQRLESNREALERTKEQMETAKIEAEKPFPREGELREKSQRLAELTKLLKLDEKDRELLDSAPEEGDDVPTRKAACRER